MNYQKINPSPSLQPYVRCYYILEHESGLGASFELESSPNPSYALVFNYGDRYQLFNSHIQGDFLPQSFLSGLSISKYTLRFQGKVGCCGVIFNGTAFRDLFDVLPPMKSLTGG